LDNRLDERADCTQRTYYDAGVNVMEHWQFQRSLNYLFNPPIVGFLCVRGKNIWEPPRPVPVEFNVNPTWPEYVQLDTGGSFTRGDSPNGAVPAAESENGKEQRQWGKEPMLRAGSRRCANCGKGFEPSVHSRHNQKYCSYRCKKEAWQAKRSTATALRAKSADHILHLLT
jgi:hypothetical protein